MAAKRPTPRPQTRRERSVSPPEPVAAKRPTPRPRTQNREGRKVREAVSREADLQKKREGVLKVRRSDFFEGSTKRMAAYRTFR